MSASQCIKCERFVSMYEKYCPECLQRYGVRQEPLFHKYHEFKNWDIERKAEFEKDIAALSVFHVSKNVQPETIAAPGTAMSLAVEQLTTKKKRKRKHVKHNY